MGSGMCCGDQCANADGKKAQELTCCVNKVRVA